MEPNSGGGLRRHFTYSNVMSTIAVFLVVAGGTALAVTLPANSVKSNTVKNNALKSVDLKDGKGVKGADVVDASLTGTDIADGGVGLADLANGAVNSAKILDSSVSGKDVATDTLTGADIVEGTLKQVPDAAKLGGKSPSAFTSSSIYKNESAVGAGTTLGDETQYIDQGCNAGDVLLSGGPANIDAETDLLESFPSPGVTTFWRARVNKNGMTDSFSVVVLCADQ